MSTSYRRMQIFYMILWEKTDEPYQISGSGRTLITRVVVMVPSS